LNESLLQTHEGVVRPEWIDYNGHMNLSYYVLLFDYATDAFLDRIGMTESFRADRQASTYAAEIHVTYLHELREGDRVRIDTQLLDYDARRVHYFHRMVDLATGKLAATNELLSLYMDMTRRKVAAMPDPLLATVRELHARHSKLPRPAQSGHVIGLKS